MKVARTILSAALLWLPLAGQTPLPGTAALTGKADFAVQMVDGINEYLLRATSESTGKRSVLWKRDYGSVENYERSISPNRQRLKKIIGAVDTRVRDVSIELVATVSTPA